MNFSFLDIDFIDIVDIALVAFLFYQFYRLLKGNLTFNLFLLLIIFSIAWFATNMLEMRLLHSILGEFYKIGAIIFLVLFQPEIRRFILSFGRNTEFSFKSIFKKRNTTDIANQKIKESIINACNTFSADKIGALIVLADKEEKDYFNNSGVEINATMSAQLLKTIFARNTPLHDGAVVIADGKIYRAGVILPVSENRSIDLNAGLRHRAAVGITEELDVKVIIVSEETGKISYAKEGILAPVPRRSLNQILDVVLVSKEMQETHEE